MRSRCCTEVTVHPRPRGEYGRAEIQQEFFGRSPPHARGILFMTRYIMDKSTFTPAYAGNTQLTQFAHTEVTVHPRLSGEYVGKLSQV